MARFWPGRGEEPLVVCECRRCGTGVDAETEVCPICGVSSTSRCEIA